MKPGMKIFGVGLGKTGTVSVHQACVRLGLRSCHDYKKCVQIAQKIKQGSRPEAVKHFDCFFDGPFNIAIKEIDAMYGPENVRYIYTYRSFNSWMTSRITHALYNWEFGDPNNEGLVRIDTDQWAEIYDKHAETAKHFPMERTLVLDRRDKYNWKNLCHFLAIDKPNRLPPFPSSNSSVSRLTQLLAKKAQPMLGKQRYIVEEVQ